MKMTIIFAALVAVASARSFGSYDSTGAHSSRILAISPEQANQFFNIPRGLRLFVADVPSEGESRQLLTVPVDRTPVIELLTSPEKKPNLKSDISLAANILPPKEENQSLDSDVTTVVSVISSKKKPTVEIVAEPVNPSASSTKKPTVEVVAEPVRPSASSTKKPTVEVVAEPVSPSASSTEEPNQESVTELVNLTVSSTKEPNQESVTESVNLSISSTEESNQESVITPVDPVNSSTIVQNKKPEVVVVKEESLENFGNGGYKYSFVLSNGQTRSETGEAVQVHNPETNEDDTILRIKGSFGYVDPESGKSFITSYVADENGFRPMIA